MLLLSKLTNEAGFFSLPIPDLFATPASQQTKAPGNTTAFQALSLSYWTPRFTASLGSLGDPLDSKGMLLSGSYWKKKGI